MLTLSTSLARLRTPASRAYHRARVSIASLVISTCPRRSALREEESTTHNTQKIQYSSIGTAESEPRRPPNKQTKHKKLSTILTAPYPMMLPVPDPSYWLHLTNDTDYRYHIHDSNFSSSMMLTHDSHYCCTLSMPWSR